MEEVKKNQEEESQKFLFQIPSMEGKTDKNYVIGVIDASGSMCSCWKWLAPTWNQCISEENVYKIITFDSKPRIAPTMKLENSIHSHGGGMTNISEAFTQFESELESLPASCSVTCIFISDGQDNHLNTLEARMSKLRGNLGRFVNFICLGVQSGFPTFLSMNLRKLYHNGDESIPPLYLIEYSSEKAFFNKFQTIIPFLKGGNLLDVIPPCRVYPWEEPKSELYEGSWVITEENYVCINDQKIDVDQNKVGIQDLVEIFRNWLQNLHLICLKDEKAGIVDAKLTLPEIHHQLDIYAKNTGIDLRVLDMKENLAFFDMALGLFMKKYGQRVNWFIEEIEKLAKGDNPKNLSEFEAAKRIQLGTITGKHQQKALALKNIPIDEFKKMKNSFIETFKQTKIESKETEKDVFPYCSLSLRKLFLQEKFIEAFEYCNSQYDLFDALALPGISINIRRNIGFEANPWLMQVKSLKLSNKTTDSSKIITNSYLLSLPISADSEEKEEINCCLPLFTTNDSDLMPFFSHQLIQMVINHLITMNADAYFEDAYYSLLAHAHLALISDQQKAEYYPEIENALFSSFELVYQEKVKEFVEQLENKPQEFFQQKSNGGSYNCSISKAFFLISYLSKKKANIEQLKKMFDNLLLQWCYEFIKENKFSVTSFFVENFDKDKIMEESRKEFDNALYLSSFKKLFSKIITKLSTGSYGMNCKALENFNSEIELSILKAFSIEQLNSEINQDTYILNLYHSIQNQNGIFSVEKSQNLEQANQFLANKIINSNQPKTKGKGKGKKKKEDNVFSLSIACESYKQLQIEYTQRFIENHSEVIPFSKDELKQECIARNINFDNLKFSVSNLPSNMCLSKKCPFYFKILPETGDSVQTALKKHMDNWQGLKPASFHAIVKENKGKSQEEIYEVLKKKIGFNEEKFKVSKEFTLEYIEKVRMKYADIKD